MRKITNYFNSVLKNVFFGKKFFFYNKVVYLHGNF